MKVAKKIDGPVALPEDIKQPSSSAEKVAPVVEKVATAEEAVEVAKKIEGSVELPEDIKHEDEKGETEQGVKEEAPVVEEAAPPTELVPEASTHETTPEQEEAPVQQEAAEDAPSEATLVNGSVDKTVAPDLAGPADETARTEKTEEAKPAEESVIKEDVAA